jgi:hypothetical protein
MRQDNLFTRLTQLGKALCACVILPHTTTPARKFQKLRRQADVNERSEDRVVFGSRRPRKGPLLLVSVEANLPHHLTIAEHS